MDASELKETQDHVLDHPQEVAIELLQARARITSLEAEIAELKEAARDLIAYLDRGDYRSNLLTDFLYSLRGLANK